MSGLGRWPKAATLDYFVKTYGEIPLGMPRCVVPAACDAWLTALELYGTMSLAQVIPPALELAEQGLPYPAALCEDVNNANWMDRWPYDREVFLPKGRRGQPGEPLVQKDLARVFRQMIEVERGNAYKDRKAAIRAARDFFYKGEVAEKMVAYCQEEEGLLTMEDMAQFAVKVEKPEMGTYHDYTLYTCGPWCQGPPLISILHLLEGYDVKGMGHNSADYLHALIEAIKLAFSDRHAYYGDPDLVSVPMAGLLSKKYADERRQMLDMAKAWAEMPPAGNPWPYQGTGARRGAAVAAPAASPGPVEADTSYACVVDRWGNAFSATPSDGIGSSPMVPGLGMIISSRGTQTWLDPDHPCRLEPWKRPRLTPNPALAFKKGRLFMPFGTPGGDMQVQAMVQMFLNIAEFGMDPQQALEEPRVGSYSFPNSFWPHSYFPGLMKLEGRIGREVGQDLAHRGHQVQWWQDWSRSASGLCGITVDQERGVLIGAADPRNDAYAMGRE